MQVSVETTSELTRKLTVQVPEEQIQEKVAKRLQSLSHQVKIDGFRPGKVPQSVVKKRFGHQVREEVLSDLIETTFQDAVRDEQLRPAGAPDITAHKERGRRPGIHGEFRGDTGIRPDAAGDPGGQALRCRYSRG